MPRIPKVVGVRQNTKDGLWKECGEKLRGKFTAGLIKMTPARAKRAKAHAVSTVNLRRIFREKDEAT